MIYNIIRLSVIGSCLCFYNGWSQDLAGVYITAEDFVSNKLSDVIDENVKPNRLYENKSAQLLTLKSGNDKKKFTFGEIYGYQSNGYKYRAVDTSYFVTHRGYAKVIDTTGLVLYSQSVAKYKASHIDYYYSQSSTGVVKPLNVENLTGDFSDYPEFILKVKTLDSHGMLFKTGSKGTYLINELYREAMEKHVKTSR